MKEKKEKKIIKLSLTTSILIFLLSILIAFFGGYFCLKNIVKKQYLKQFNNEQINIDNNKSENKNIKKKYENVNVFKNRKNNKTEKKNNDNNIEEFSSEDIKLAIQNYLDLKGECDGSPEGMLIILNLIKENETKEKNDDLFVKTNVKFSTFKDIMLNYVTEEMFEKKFARVYKNINGYLYYYDGGATGISFEVNDVYIKGDFSDNIDNTYVAKTHNNKLYFESWEVEYIEFRIENSNGRCVISYCDY